MSSNQWEQVDLGTLAIKITKGTTPSTIGKSFTASGVKYYRAENLTSSKTLSESNIKYIDDITHEKLKRSQLEQDDILFSMAGAYLGKTAIVRKNNIPSNINQAIALVRLNQHIADVNYIYYYLNQNKIVKLINSVPAQSAQPNINLKEIGSIPVLLPSLLYQRSMGSLLSTLDEKIELNNAINKNLEEMAQALFKRWFVDFEFPNENDEPYKSSGGEFEESEIGLIPKGWKIGRIEDLGEIIGGATPSKKEEKYYSVSGIPWITPKDLSSNKSKFISRGEIDISQEGFKKSSVKLLPKGSVLFSSRAPIGYIAIADNEITTNQGFKSIIPKNQFGTEFMYYLMKYLTPDIENRATGSTFKEISGTEMKKISVQIPELKIIHAFNAVVSSFFGKIKQLECEIRYLTDIRDALLPKLMSGEIRVPIDEQEQVSNN